MTSVNTVAHELRDIHQALVKLQGRKDGVNHLYVLGLCVSNARQKIEDSRRK